MEFDGIVVCKHRYGNKMTYTEQTDGVHFNESYRWMTESLKVRKLRAGIFVTMSDLKSDYITRVKDDVDSGLIGADMYSSIYPSLLDRVCKTHRRMTGEEWQNFYYQALMPAYYRVFKRLPISISYAYGNDTYKDSICEFLGGRNSGTDGDHTYEYKGLRNAISRKSTIRWYDNMIRGGG